MVCCAVKCVGADPAIRLPAAGAATVPASLPRWRHYLDRGRSGNRAQLQDFQLVYGPLAGGEAQLAFGSEAELSVIGPYASP
jgi:hypothetical protein